jgi:hypothetical protein
MVFVSIQSFGAVALVLALGNVVSGAPTPSSDFDLIPNTVEEVFPRGVSQLTGYEANTKFMAASKAYHELTEGE